MLVKGATVRNSVPCCQKRSAVHKVDIKGRDKSSHPSVSMGCNYLSLPRIHASGTPLLKSETSEGYCNSAQMPQSSIFYIYIYMCVCVCYIINYSFLLIRKQCLYRDWWLMQTPPLAMEVFPWETGLLWRWMPQLPYIQIFKWPKKIAWLRKSPLG